jgi:hypothetical protein
MDLGADPSARAAAVVDFSPKHRLNTMLAEFDPLEECKVVTTVTGSPSTGELLYEFD